MVRITINLVLSLLLAAGCSADGDELEPAPDVAGEYTIVEYSEGPDCDSPGPLIPDEYATMTVAQSMKDGFDYLFTPPCDDAVACESVFTLDIGTELGYSGDGHWDAYYTSSVGFDCDATRRSATVDLLEDGRLEIHTRVQSAGVPSEGLFGCDLGAFPDDAPCEQHQVVIAAPM